MKDEKQYTKKGAASIYIVIFTTTVLGIIALSFVRIMLAEADRMTNYSLSQSAYNAALAGVEDAKIVLLRYQSCVNKGSYTSSGGNSKDCSSYNKLFSTYEDSLKTSQDCSAIGRILHKSTNSETETLIQRSDNSENSIVDQAYTCVKVSAYTDDFLAVLKDDNPTKIIPLRSESQDSQDSINRIHLEWFDDENYQEVSDTNNYLKNGYTGFWKNSKTNVSDLVGELTTNVGTYPKNTDKGFNNKFTSNPLAPPVLQVSLVQTAQEFTIDQFYTASHTSGDRATNRGTLLLRPTSDEDVKNTTQDKSNVLPSTAFAESTDKSFNTPIDVYCEPTNPNAGEASTAWGNYACSADIHIPKPINYSSSNRRNMTTAFFVVNLPYGAPTTNISVKMYSCKNDNKSIAYVDKDGNTNCEIVHFANVQPSVDSTGRSSDLFRRVESRIELADINFPIANYALAMTDPANATGIEKDFYVTSGFSYSTSSVFKENNAYVVKKTELPKVIDGETSAKYNSGKTGEAKSGNGS